MAPNQPDLVRTRPFRPTLVEKGYVQIDQNDLMTYLKWWHSLPFIHACRTNISESSLHIKEQETKFSGKLYAIRLMSCETWRYYSKTDLPKSGLPLYSGQMTCHWLILHFEPPRSTSQLRTMDTDQTQAYFSQYKLPLKMNSETTLSWMLVDRFCKTVAGFKDWALY